MQKNISRLVLALIIGVSCAFKTAPAAAVEVEEGKEAPYGYGSTEESLRKKLPGKMKSGQLTAILVKPLAEQIQEDRIVDSTTPIYHLRKKTIDSTSPLYLSKKAVERAETIVNGMSQRELDKILGGIQAGQEVVITLGSDDKVKEIKIKRAGQFASPTAPEQQPPEKIVNPDAEKWSQVGGQQQKFGVEYKDSEDYSVPKIKK